MGAHFEAFDGGVLLVPLDPRYTQVGFNIISVQVCNGITLLAANNSLINELKNYEKLFSDSKKANLFHDKNIFWMASLSNLRENI